jgi:hypothetical protein
MISVKRKILCSITAAIAVTHIRNVSAFVNPGGENHFLGPCPKPPPSVPGRLKNRSLFPRNFEGTLPFRGGEAGDPSMAAQQSESSDDSVERATSYYLVWSPGFAKKFVLMTVGLLVLHLTRVDGHVGKIFSRAWGVFSGPLQGVLSLGPNFILPLLSSSCCLLQLVINVLVGSSGCAGFNTVLGPFRPYFLSFLAYLNLFSRPQAPEALLRYSIALMPEFLHFWNRLVSSQWRRSHSMTLQQNRGSISATVQVDIPTMGCVACINKIESSLRQCAPAKIVDATSWLDPDSPKGGRAKVMLSADSEEDLNALTELIVHTIAGAGFGGSSVTAVEVEDSKQ